MQTNSISAAIPKPPTEPLLAMLDPRRRSCFTPRNHSDGRDVGKNQRTHKRLRAGENSRRVMPLATRVSARATPLVRDEFEKICLGDDRDRPIVGGGEER